MEVLRRGGLLGAILGLVGACNAINGSSDLSIDELGIDSGVTAPTRPPDEPVIDSGVDAPGDVGTDGPPIAIGTCTCAPAPPTGWQGPMALAESLQGTGPACDVGLVTAYKGGVPPATTPPCTPCSCSAAAGARCDVTLSLFGTTNCAAASLCSTVPLNGLSCSTINYCSVGSSNAMRTALTVVGSCNAPTGGAKTAPAFAREATACALPNPPMGACEAGSACSPSPASGTKTCIRQAGDVACPAGPYTTKATFFGKLVDGRTCSACTCSASCTGGSTRVASDNACATQVDSTGPNVCDPYTTTALAGSARVLTAATLACTAGGGAVSGTVTGEEPTTFCCLPL